MMMKDLKAHLEELPLSQMEVRIREGFAWVISTDFIGMDMGDRQGMIWGHLLDRLNYDELYDFEFVYTYTPDEMAALQRGERPVMQGGEGERRPHREVLEELDRNLAPLLARLRGESGAPDRR
jgi:acid stress-induced BolA-like protein IbaG/YrbA